MQMNGKKQFSLKKLVLDFLLYALRNYVQLWTQVVTDSTIS
jgi:hypothetical protein